MEDLMSGPRPPSMRIPGAEHQLKLGTTTTFPFSFVAFENLCLRHCAAHNFTWTASLQLALCAAGHDQGSRLPRDHPRRHQAVGA
jgi:hypothetical protein